ncbi:hypothetical protein Tco_1457685 [Tanacetum coccineum]
MLVQTRRQLATDPEMCMFALTVSIVEPKNIKEAMADSAWIEAMQDELHQFDRLKVWELVDKPFGKMIIKLHVEEGINFEESFALVARLEAVWIFVAYAAHKGNKVLFRTTDPPVPKRRLIMPDALILVKALLEETVPFDKLCKLDVQRNKTALQVFSIGRVFGVICKLSQLMGLRTQLSDYGFNTNKIPLYSDSHSALAISSPRTTLHGQHTILGIPSKRNRLKMEIN